MDDIILQSELESKRIRNGLCPVCGHVVLHPVTREGSVKFVYREAKCTHCSFEIKDGIYDQGQGYCSWKKG